MDAGLPVALTMGDPAGIGPEIAAKSWRARTAHDLPVFALIGDPAAVRAVWDGPVEEIGTPEAAADVFDHALPVIPVRTERPVEPGRPTEDGARAALQALELGVGLARAGSVGAVVTGPVSKERLYDIGFTHPGQTEFIAERCGVSKTNVAMMLAGPSLRCVPVTGHVALVEVEGLLSTELIVARARATLRGLIRNFGIERPRLAVAGMNPHAGENGAIGREEIDLIEPAVKQLREEGWDVVGPLPADTMFHARARADYDAALAMYHDQALIPLKALHFDEGVNMTLGLPIVRTSADHGTAFGIAGTDVALPDATIAALTMAAEAVRHRASQGNPLPQAIDAPAE
ncbi:4-hydroxythreonine-4-phosphate dehydrogenase PdxA [Sphingomicrobium sp. XHP0239]|uniref:4-hydroxythreonine-4-phosphate dehydrogenase PdxA n=1 Tax=Sphingomicrobium maritimum TaxID=3133972 RepID=UPI0031CC73F4